MPIGKRQQQVNGPINPITFHKEKGNTIINPFRVIDDHPNDKTKFAILKTTENGKYVRGGMLYFEFRGVEIYTEINNAIFVDTVNNSIFIKEYQKVIDEITPEDPNEKQYILLMKCMDQNGEYYVWEAMQGRNSAYEYIINNLDDMNIDPENSFVLVETVPYKDALSITGFIKYLQNAELVDPEEFDIDAYIY